MIGVRASGAERELWRGSSGTGEKAVKRARYGKGGPKPDVAGPDAGPSSAARPGRVDLGPRGGDRAKPNGGAKGRWSQSDRDKRDARKTAGSFSGGARGARGARGGADGDSAPKSRTFGKANPADNRGTGRAADTNRSGGSNGGDAKRGAQGRSFGKRPGSRGPSR